MGKILITESLLYNLFPLINKSRGKVNKDANIKGFVYTLNKYANYFGIDTKLEYCHFISQLAHESDQFNAFEEYASGSAYEGRKDLGNTVKGYGVKYKGRGPIQTTGYFNYDKVGKELLELPFLNDKEKDLFINGGIHKNPSILKDPVWGTLAALIYWRDKELNTLCMPDNYKVAIQRYNGTKWYKYVCSPIEAITRKINGGLNGFEERVKYYKLISNKI